jgi:anti-anti-sigma factor
MGALIVEKRDADPRARILALSGQLDATTYQELDAAIDAAAAEKLRWVILDASGLDRLSAAGAGAFLGAQSKLGEAGGGLVIAGLDESLLENLEMLGLLDVFPLAGSAESALAGL